MRNGVVKIWIPRRREYYYQADDCPVCGGAMFPREGCEVCGYHPLDISQFYSKELLRGPHLEWPGEKRERKRIWQE